MKYTCPHCHQVFSVNHQPTGRAGSSQVLSAPAVPAARAVRCPGCRHVFALVRPSGAAAPHPAGKAGGEGRTENALDDQVLRWLEEEADSSAEIVQAALAASLAVAARKKRPAGAVAVMAS